MSDRARSKSRPNTGAERTRRWRQRKAAGLLLNGCRSCAAPWQARLATPARQQAGLCLRCWQATPEGLEERRAADRHRYAVSAERRRRGLERVRRHRQRQRGGEVTP